MSNAYVDMTLWKNPPCTEDKPTIFDKVDNALYIGNYDESGEPMTLKFHNLAPQTPALNMKFRVPYAGKTALKANECQYCELRYYAENEKGQMYLHGRYFLWIESLRWIANQTLELSLKMDVLNSLEDVLERNSATFDDIFDARTMIHRMHKDRFYKAYDSYLLTAHIDETPEQLGSFTLLKRSDDIIYDRRFYTTDSPSVPDAVKDCSWVAYYGKLDTEGEGAKYQYVVLFPHTNDTINVNIKGVKKDDGGFKLANLATSGMIDTTFSGAIKAINYPYLPYVYKAEDGTYTEGETTYTILNLKVYMGGDLPDKETTLRGYYGAFANSSEDYEGLGTMIGTMDIIPVETLGMEYLPKINVYSLPSLSQSVTSRVMTRGLTDTKLLHSDFFDLRFVYDSFSYSVKYEQIGNTTNEAPKLNIYFFASTSPVSRFGFLFEKEGWLYPSVGDKVSDMDFDFMDCSRNNEVTLYNDDYLNYMRNGYNYDVKSRAISAVTQLASGTASTAMGFAVGGALGATMSATSALIGAISSFAQGDNSLQSKMASLQAKSASVSGSDSLSLMRAYSGNKLHVMKYTLNSTLMSMVSNLFYYYGYRCEYQGKPDTTSRHWWNFIQCSPKFARTWVNRLPKFMIDEITKKCEYGITRFHRDTSSSNENLVLGYDIDQKMENIESKLWSSLRV